MKIIKAGYIKNFQINSAEQVSLKGFSYPF